MNSFPSPVLPAKPYFGLSEQHTETCTNTQATSKRYALQQLYGRLSSLITSSLRNSILPPEMEINPPKTALGCPRSRAMIICNSHTRSPLVLWNATVNCIIQVTPSVHKWGMLQPPPPRPPPARAAGKRTDRLLHWSQPLCWLGRVPVDLLTPSPHGVNLLLLVQQQHLGPLPCFILLL